MLPMLGMLVAGYMSKEGAGAAPAAAAKPAGGLAGLLDADGDGNPLNDVMGMFGKLKG
jgi:hypothetical protein